MLVSQKRIERYGERAGLRQVLGHEATTDVDGRAEITGLKAGTTYCAFAIDEGDSWIAPIGLVEGASYGRPARLRASLELVEREVLVRSASGELFPEVEYGWAYRSMTTEGSRAWTGRESKMTLRMPPGVNCLYRTDLQRPALVPFEWRAGEGALVIEMPEGE